MNKKRNDMRDRIESIIDEVIQGQKTHMEASDELCVLLDVTQCAPMQKCPKCDGQGIVSKPPWVAGDQHSWDSTSINHHCDVCNGQKIIPMAHGG